MSYRHLLAFFAPVLLVLPVTAAQWPAAAKTEFARECVASAQVQHSQAKLQAYCECAAEQVSADFTEAELQAMGDQPDAAMQERLLASSGRCNAKLD